MEWEGYTKQQERILSIVEESVLKGMIVPDPSADRMVRRVKRLHRRVLAARATPALCDLIFSLPTILYRMGGSGCRSRTAVRSDGPR